MTEPYRRASSTCRSACEARICPIGAASGGQPASARTRPTSSSTSSRRSAAACARRWTSSAATRPGREVVLCGPHGDARRDGGDGLVADALVDHVRGLPQLADLEPRGRGRGPAATPRPTRRTRDEASARADRRSVATRSAPASTAARADARPMSGRALDVEADGEPARLPDPRHELLRTVRDERARRVVHEDPRRAELRQLPRRLDERVGLARAARAVHEPGVERAAGVRDRRARLAQVRDVVRAGRGAGRRRCRSPPRTRRSG